VTLRDYVLIVARSWIVVAVSVAVGLMTAAIVSIATTTTYTASAQVLFSGHASTSGQDLAYVGNYVQSRMQTYKRVGTSTSLMNTVAASMQRNEAPRDLASRTEIEVSQLSTVATVSATDTTAKGAAETASTVAAALIETVQKIEGENAGDPTGGEKPAKATVQGVITGQADIPESPSAPNVPLFLLVGLFAGFAVSLGVVALREVLKGETEASSPGEEP
jgi:capsular polysaccharide biosynthesis protein